MTSGDEPHARRLYDDLANAFGEVRAEYESDDDLFERFSEPAYADRLLGMAPAFLVGGRGTGKTTTLRSLSFRGQERITGLTDAAAWSAIGAYWRAEPNTVSAFRGKGVPEVEWQSVFGHYLNLRLSALVLDYVCTYSQPGLANNQFDLFCLSLHLSPRSTAVEVAAEVRRSLVLIESKLNGSVKELATMPMSLLGQPLALLFEALRDPRIDHNRPFVFCIDEYENFEPYQQVLLNTLIKSVGASPFTFKIGVRDGSAIVRETLTAGQPLQDPADFSTVDIVQYLKDEKFAEFAREVIEQRLDRLEVVHPDLATLLPPVPLSEEVRLLAGPGIRGEILAGISDRSTYEFAADMSDVQLAVARYWASTQQIPLSDVVEEARAFPKRWQTRVGNHSHEMLFTLRERAVGPRKYYSGWRTFCQMSDGNIRYLIRVTYEALRLHARTHDEFSDPVSYVDQTEAARRAGATTLRELQGWSREGGALTRLTLGLGRIFGGLAREIGATTPEVNQFRVRYVAHGVSPESVEGILKEAVAQGVLLAFDGDKNARLSGATRELDYQLHPIFAAYFTYSARRKRRMMISAEDILAMTTRQSSRTIRRILESSGVGNPAVPEQLRIFEDGLDVGP